MPAADESGAGTRARINSQSHCLPWHRLRSRSGRNGEANWGAKFGLIELEDDGQVKCKQRTALRLFATAPAAHTAVSCNTTCTGTRYV